ncbi:MAG: hypothetical protein JJU02_10360 [Cryomorphaceae bacterium]|nr:hypothetical protein [Cryomorphaceae bacterium]
MRLHINNYPIWAILTFSFLLTSCANIKNAQLNSQLDKSNCSHQTAYSYSKGDLPKPIHSINIDTVLTNRFSFQALNAGNAIGILDLLSDYVNLKKDYKLSPTIEKRIEIVYALFFGEGGKYTADQLTNRANMHDQIEAQINLMKQDLKLLALELEKVNNP